MPNKIIFIIFLTFTILVDTFSDILFKKWAVSQDKLMLIAGLISIVITGILWSFSLKYEFLSKSVVIYNVANLILAVTAGMVLFKEELSTTNLIGVALGIVSIVLLQL